MLYQVSNSACLFFGKIHSMITSLKVKVNKIGSITKRWFLLWLECLENTCRVFRFLLLSGPFFRHGSIRLMLRFSGRDVATCLPARFIKKYLELTVNCFVWFRVLLSIWRGKQPAHLRIEWTEIGCQQGNKNAAGDYYGRVASRYRPRRASWIQCCVNRSGIEPYVQGIPDSDEGYFSLS